MVLMRSFCTIARGKTKALRHLSSSSSNQKHALVIGSSGCLGSNIAKYLSRQQDMIVFGADVVEMPNDFLQSDWELDAFVPMPLQEEQPTISEFTVNLATGVHEVLSEVEHLDLVVCASVRTFYRNCYGFSLLYQ